MAAAKMRCWSYGTVLVNERRATDGAFMEAMFESSAPAQALGASHARILVTELLPNIVTQLIVVGTLEVANAILLEAALSFLGLGVRPPTPSWGLMIAEGREHILFDAWLITFPGLALLVLVLAINLLGDGLRDATAPASRG